MKPKIIPLVVTTELKGVFFGWGVWTTDTIIRLEKAQMCIRWSEDVKGVLGLAATGPSSNCRVGPAVPAITVQKVTSLIECSPEAVKAWEATPWR